MIGSPLFRRAVGAAIQSFLKEIVHHFIEGTWEILYFSMIDL
jgi:hypothetical protein